MPVTPVALNISELAMHSGRQSIASLAQEIGLGFPRNAAIFLNLGWRDRHGQDDNRIRTRAIAAFMRRRYPDVPCIIVNCNSSAFAVHLLGVLSENNANANVIMALSDRCNDGRAAADLLRDLKQWKSLPANTLLTTHTLEPLPGLPDGVACMSLGGRVDVMERQASRFLMRAVKGVLPTLAAGP